MDKLTMIDALRERADISYEEAKAVLEAAGDDLLEAILILEKEGKIHTAQETETAEEMAQETAGPGAETVRMETETKQEEKQAAEGSFRESLRSAFSFVLHTSLHITRRGKEVFAMPTLVPVLLLPPFWGVMIPAVIISLFFEVRYSFEGTNTQAANDFCEKAGAFADGVESGLQK